MVYCEYCKHSILMDGIIRNSKIYCNTTCYSNAYSIKTIIKTCNYCFDKFDININRGIDYKTLWFCCDAHLQLANPRPKVMVGGVWPPIIHHTPVIVAPPTPYNLPILPTATPTIISRNGHFLAHVGPWPHMHISNMGHIGFW